MSETCWKIIQSLLEEIPQGEMGERSRKMINFLRETAPKDKVSEFGRKGDGKRLCEPIAKDEVSESRR